MLPDLPKPAGMAGPGKVRQQNWLGWLCEHGCGCTGWAVMIEMAAVADLVLVFDPGLVSN